MKTEQLHFVIEGPWLTDFTRSLWADEKEPAKAIRILESAFPEMSKGTLLAILQGEKRLKGDSDKGITLVPDDRTTTPVGNSLFVEGILQGLQDKLQESEEYGADISQLLSGNTRSCGSREGLVAYPYRRKAAVQAGNIKLEDIPHRVITPLGSCKGRFFEKLEDEKVRKPASLPKPERFISTNCGWLSPEGKFYPCSYKEHADVALRLGFEDSFQKEHGWIKVHANGFVAPDHDATQFQLDMIFDWCQKHDEPMPGWTKEESYD